MHRHKLLSAIPSCANRIQMPSHRIVLLVLGVCASAIPTGAILTESPLNPHVNPTPFPSLTTSRSSSGVRSSSSSSSSQTVSTRVSLSAHYNEIATFAPFSTASQETTDELGSTRFNGETNKSNNVDADYYKQQDSFLPSSYKTYPHYHPPSLFSPTSAKVEGELTQSATKPYQQDPIYLNGRFSYFSGNGRVALPVVGKATLDFQEISTTSPPFTRLPTFSSPVVAPAHATPLPSPPLPPALGGKIEFISSPLVQQSLSGSLHYSSHFFQSPSSSTFPVRATVGTAKRSVGEPPSSLKEEKEQSLSITRFPDKPSFATASSSSFPVSSLLSTTASATTAFDTSTTDTGSTLEGKQSNINLLRKLWESTRSGKLNLTEEHRSLLRIESESATPPIVRELVSSPSVVVEGVSPVPALLLSQSSPVESTELKGEKQQQHRNGNQVTTTNRPTSTWENSPRIRAATLSNDYGGSGLVSVASHTAAAVSFNELPVVDAIQDNDHDHDGDKREAVEKANYNGEKSSLSNKSVFPSLSTTTITPTQAGAPLLSSSPLSSAPFDMTSLHSSPSQPNSKTTLSKAAPFYSTTEATAVRGEYDRVKESESNQQAPLLLDVVTTSNFSSSSTTINFQGVGSSFPRDEQVPSLENKVLDKKGRDEEEATVVTTKLAFPFADGTTGASENAKENLIKLKQSLSALSSSSLSSSTAQFDLAAEKGSEKMELPRQEHHLMLYPEWLSSGGVYPDDDTSVQASPSLGALATAAISSYGNNGTGIGGSNGSPGAAEYYNEPEYEPLISGEGSSVSRISSHLYNFAVPNRNLPPPPPLPALTEEEDIRDEEEFKRYARLREKLADELLQDVVAAAGARRNWQNGRNGNANSNNNRDEEMMMMQKEQPEGEEVEGLGDRESRFIVDSSKLGTAGNNGNGGVVSTESPQAIIAQQSGLADVISRGRIDSVMYVYFGDKLNDYHTEEIAGRVIQAVGGVIAAVAQVLTVLGAAKCVRRNAPSHTLPVHLHIGFALLISNLLLLLAVHATEPTDICASVAMILHYLHLVIGCWLFAHTVQTYRELRRHVESPNLLDDDAEDNRFGEVPRRPTRPNILPYCFAAWAAPLPFILVSYLVNPDGYETRHYCWMSIEKGMVVSFIVPVFLLIGMNTLLVVLALRHLLALRKLWHDSSGSTAEVMDEHSLDEKMIGNGIRASAMLLPLLAVMWFLEVVALENATSIFFQVAAAVANIALSWLVMYFLGNEIWPDLWCQFSKASRANSILSMDDPCVGSSVQPSAAHLSFDNEPLLGIAPTSAAASSSSSSSLASASRTSSMIMPSTSKAATGTATTVAANATTSVAGPSATNNNYYTSTSFSSMGKKSSSGQCATTPKGMNSLPMSVNANIHTSSNIIQHSGSQPSAPKINGGTSKKVSKGGLLMKSKPNWSQPGGNEIYELKLDSISTICK